jgi:hypothetical protein
MPSQVNIRRLSSKRPGRSSTWTAARSLGLILTGLWPWHAAPRGGLFMDADGNFHTPEAEQAYRDLHPEGHGDG